MNARTGNWIAAAVMLGLLPGCLRVREISPVPPPVGLDHARMVIINDGDRVAEMELIHSDTGRFRMAEKLQPGQIMIRDVPAGKYDGMEAVPIRPGVMKDKRDDLKLDGGKSYEWRIGKRN